MNKIRIGLISPFLTTIIVSSLSGCSPSDIAKKLDGETKTHAKSTQVLNNWDWLENLSLGCDHPSAGFVNLTFKKKTVDLTTKYGYSLGIKSLNYDGVGFNITTRNSTIKFLPTIGKYDGKLSTLTEFKDENDKDFMCYFFDEGHYISTDGSINDLKKVLGSWQCGSELKYITFGRILEFYTGESQGKAIFVGKSDELNNMQLHLLYHKKSTRVIDSIKKYNLDLSEIRNGKLKINNNFCDRV